MSIPNLILASKSPRRREILENLHIPLTVRCADADETLHGRVLPSDAVREICLRKLNAIADSVSDTDLLLAADTVVAVDDEIFGKPKNEADAVRMLSAMSGRAHSVFTGYALRYGSKTVTGVEETRVFFREISREDILFYLRREPPYDKAGAYGIQELAGLFVEKIEGDYFNIVGLPVSAIADCCRRSFGISFFSLVK